MKKILCLILTICIALVCFSACTENKPAEEQATHNVTDEAPEPLMPEIEYTDVLYLMDGELLGKADSECGLPEESLFLTGDNVVGYDYVCIGDAIGNITFYLTDDVITSYVFGSAPYDNADEFQCAFDEMNGKISDCLGTEIKSSSFHGGSPEEDTMESLFAGKSVMVADYVTDDFTVSVSGCGVNGIATIVVECKLIEAEG